jgi:hypothetical protein
VSDLTLANTYENDHGRMNFSSCGARPDTKRFFKKRMKVPIRSGDQKKEKKLFLLHEG